MSLEWRERLQTWLIESLWPKDCTTDGSMIKEWNSKNKIETKIYVTKGNEWHHCINVLILKKTVFKKQVSPFARLYASKHLLCIAFWHPSQNLMHLALLQWAQVCDTTSVMMWTSLAGPCRWQHKWLLWTHISSYVEEKNYSQICSECVATTWEPTFWPTIPKCTLVASPKLYWRNETF